MKVKLILFIVFCTFLFSAESILTCKDINECSAQTGCGITNSTGNCLRCWAESGYDYTNLHYWAGGMKQLCGSAWATWGGPCYHVHM